MIILDEMFPESQVALLRGKRVPVRQIGPDLGHKGMKDDEVIALLHQLNRPTFFTSDRDFFDARLRHAEYCLVHLDVGDDVLADFMRRVLRHAELKTKAKRMGLVISASQTGMIVWRIHREKKYFLSWG